ncbi:GNAT family N-acetyltransferase [Devosia sp. 2618]|uniref:GNAT family N-acetyltransferase n=1 Tax=Devosia sp. 2618 TaxID=3156454 RepID=UPI00339810D3
MDSIKDRLPVSLQTERLVLTKPAAAHVQAIATLANNRRLNEMMSRLPFPYTEDDARFFVDTIVPSDSEHCFAVLADGDTFIGIVGLTLTDPQTPELGYWFGEPHWGQGYATEAATAVVASAKAAGFPALRSRALLRNAGSRNVLRKVGFVEKGEHIETEGNLAGQTMMLMWQDFSR